MRLKSIAFGTLTALLLPLTVAAQDTAGRIYGTIYTADGEEFEGLIRWDKNEASWVDMLDGSKRVYRDRRRSNRSREFFGIRWEDGNSSSTTKTSGIRFGHLEAIENIGRDKALLILRNGEEVEFSGGSTDIGTDMRELVIEDPRRGEIEFRWRDIDRVEFSQAPATQASAFGERIYGSLETRDGDIFTGYITWDIDEVVGNDVLDGDDRERRRRKIKFRNIERIERNSSSSARVTYKNGEEVVLRGTNDVNSSNSDILVLDPMLGQVRVDWNDFDNVVFTTPSAPYTYNDFGNSGALRGTVTTYDGDKYTGFIRWDNDEEYAWELLNGNLDDIEFEVEFGMIQSIERRRRGSEVTLRDGRAFELEGSNDVNEDNDGIIIIADDGDEIFVDWYDFERIDFEK